MKIYLFLVILFGLSCTKQNINGNTLLVSDPESPNHFDPAKRIVGPGGQTNLSGGGWVIHMDHKASYFAANCTAKIENKGEYFVFELDMGRDKFGFPIKFYSNEPYKTYKDLNIKSFYSVVARI